MKQTRHLKAFRRKVKSVFETGISNALRDTGINNGLKSSNQISFPSGPHSQIERCLSDEIIYAHPSVDTVVLQNFQFLFALLVVMLPASIIILLYRKQYNV